MMAMDRWIADALFTYLSLRITQSGRVSERAASSRKWVVRVRDISGKSNHRPADKTNYSRTSNTTNGSHFNFWTKVVKGQALLHSAGLSVASFLLFFSCFALPESYKSTRRRRIVDLHQRNKRFWQNKRKNGQVERLFLFFFFFFLLSIW